MIKKFKKLFGLIFISCSFLFTLVSCNLMGNPYEGIMISAITADNLSNGDTELTITFTDEDVEPITLLIPKGKQGDQGEIGKAGTGISSITSKDSEDGLTSTLTITYTDKNIPASVFTVKHGVSVIDITSIQNVSNNTTKVTFKLSDGSSKDVEIPNGKDGIGIKDVVTSRNGNKDYIITISYTGGRADSIITLPNKNGKDGRGISSIVGSQEGSLYVIQISYTDGTDEEPFVIDLPKPNQWYRGSGSPDSEQNQSYLNEAREGDYYFDTTDCIIYAYSQNKFNLVIDLKKDSVSSEKYEVIFDANGGQFTGSVLTKISVSAGRPINSIEIPIPTHPDGKRFVGYYTSSQGPNNPLSGKLTDLTPIYKDTTFYAIYE